MLSQLRDCAPSNEMRDHLTDQIQLLQLSYEEARTKSWERRQRLLAIKREIKDRVLEILVQVGQKIEGAQCDLHQIKIE